MAKGRKKKEKERQREAGRQSDRPEDGHGLPVAAGTSSSPVKTTVRAGWQGYLCQAGLCAATIILLTASFAPFDLWWLAYFALAPWCLSLAGQSRGRAALTGLLLGLFFWAMNVYWLWWITLAGYFPMIVYLSAYWLAALLIRSAMQRNWPIWLVLPTVWVSLEFARSYIISGFPWFFLAHTQYAQTELIQITDVTGQYGVSFFVAMVNGAIMDMLLEARRRQAGLPQNLRRLAFGAAAVAASLIAMVCYGNFRMGQKTFSTGPVIGVVQQAVPISLSGRSESSEKVMQRHLDSIRTLAGAGCQLVLTPETMFPSGINRECLDLIESNGRKAEYADMFDSARQIGEVSRELDCPIFIGAISYHKNPQPIGEGDFTLSRNSVLCFDRSDRDSAIYSKVQLVPFSEYVPFKDDWPAFHNFLRTFVPPVMSQLDPGRQFTSFTIKGPARNWSMAAPICYEGTFDRVCRRMVYEYGRKKADILANISNDGWFYWQWANHASTENALHMSHYVFRAIENRVPVVRAVNTGISCSIDSNGRILAMIGQKAGADRYQGTPMAVGSLLLDGKPNVGREGSSGSPLAHGPLIMIDSRESMYGRIADIFAWTISMIGAVLAGIMIFARPKEKV
ncbi:MAG: apolipoprotein N-acyltransferase [Planctomycetes bacterium]|nr:apolipoprotein N-acyltransferase [Planctomycetota bacterium]